MKFNQIIDKLNEDYGVALKSGTGQAYEKLSMIFEKLEEHVRECIQETTSKEIKVVIANLKKGGTLSSDEIAMLRLWIIGDAENYAKYENNYPDWQAELGRLVQEITKLEDENLELAELVRLRALFRDATRVVDDIFYYLEQKDRVERFEEATKEIDPEERAMLIRLLEQKLKSKDF